MIRLRSFTSLKKALFGVAVLGTTLSLIPANSFAQQERKVRNVDLTHPVGSPPAPKTKKATTSEPDPATQSEAEKLTNAPTSKESAIKDSVSASGLAWTYFDKHNYAKAQEWFTLALEWYPGNLHAAEGLVMALFESGDPQTAYYVARELDEKIPGIKDLVIESASTRARGLMTAGKVAEARTWVTGFPSDETGFASIFAEVEKAAESSVLQLTTVTGGQNNKKIAALPHVPVNDLLTHAEGAMQEGRYHVSQWYLTQVEARQEISPEFKMMKAWNYYYTHQFDLGAALFEELYRAEENLEAAEGLAFCLQQDRKFEKLTKLSNELGGMLISTAAPIIETARRQQQSQTPPNFSPVADNQPAPTSEIGSDTVELPPVR